jgi:hypothetical protein
VLRKRAGCFKYLLVLAAIVALEQAATAQSTIFNIPATDTVAKGKAYFEFDFLPQIPATQGVPRSYIYIPRLGNDSYSDPSNNNRYLFVYYGITFP